MHTSEPFAALQRLAAHDPDTVRRALFSAYRDDDAGAIELSVIFHEDLFALNLMFTAVYTLAVMFVSERGVRADPGFSNSLSDLLYVCVWTVEEAALNKIWPVPVLGIRHLQDASPQTGRHDQGGR